MEIDELQSKLKEINADFEIIQHDIPIKSKADALGYFNLEETAPTLIIESEEGYFAMIISGERDKVDLEMVKQLLGCSSIRMAQRKELHEKLHLEPGQVPLIGHGLKCIVDNALLKYRYVYGGTGNSFYTLKINPNDLIKANRVILQFD
jgi:prolyl-tRNA editing enzyme YbaK/EbsC (Cys-tRNA(Pro) deacylase)